MPRIQPDGDFDFTKPFLPGYYMCRRQGKLFRAWFLLFNQFHRTPLLNLLKTQRFPYPATVVYNGRMLTFSLNNGFTSIASATYDLSRDELINVKTMRAFRRRGLSRLLIEFIVRYFGPAYITASATPASGGAPTSVLLNFYASFGYQIIPNSNRLTIMSNLAAIKQRDRESHEDALEAEREEERELAGVQPLETSDRLALQAIHASSNSEAVRTLNRMYTLLHEPNTAEISRLLSAQSQEPAALITAITIYNQEWFDNRPWAPYHKAEFAQSMATMLDISTGRTNSLWNNIAALV